MDTDIFILIAIVGDKVEDSTPYAFITLDKFKSFIEKHFEELTEEDELYMSVLVPNYPVPNKGDFSVLFSYDGEEGTFSIDDGHCYLIEDNWTLFIETIRNHYLRRISSK